MVSQHRADAHRLSPARAVQQRRVPAGAAWPWWGDPAFDGGALRTHSRDHRVQGARVSLADNRRHRAGRRALHHWLRSSRDHWLAWHRGRSGVRRRRHVFRGVRRAAQIVEHGADPGGRGHQRAVAGSFPDRIFRVGVSADDRRRLSREPDPGAGAGRPVRRRSRLILFTRAVVLLGAAKAAVFPALVPPFTLMTGYLFLGNIPTALQLVGLVLVLTGFRLTQKS